MSRTILPRHSAWVVCTAVLSSNFSCLYGNALIAKLSSALLDYINRLEYTKKMRNIMLWSNSLHLNICLKVICEHPFTFLEFDENEWMAMKPTKIGVELGYIFYVMGLFCDYSNS